MKSKKTIGIILIILSLALIIFIAKFFKADNGVPTNKEFVEALDKYIDEDQKDILEEVLEAKYKPGLYLYEFSQEDLNFKIYKFISPDNRILTYNESDIITITDDKYNYFASQVRKNYIKRDLKDLKDFNENIGVDNDLSISQFIDPHNEVYPDLDIRKEGDYSIIENERCFYKYDKNGVLVEDRGLSGGEDYTQKLVKYDEDFDKYYNKYLEEILSYEEVNDIGEVSPK